MTPGKPLKRPAGRWTYVLTSLLLLVPCYWQPRIQGGDLSSRIYNAWLTQWIGLRQCRHLRTKICE